MRETFSDERWSLIMKKRKSRVKVLSNKAFCKLWDVANKVGSLEEYIGCFTSVENDKPIVDFKKYNLDYIETLDMLKSIYTLAKYSFRDILELSGKRKSQVSDIFCIPIRTVEEWYSGNNKCSSYIRLMMLKEFHLLFLGSKYIKLESEVEYLSSYPRIYEYHERQSDLSGVNTVVEDKPSDDFYGSLDPEVRTCRTDADREFFRKYGFFPDSNISWRNKE